MDSFVKESMVKALKEVDSQIKEAESLIRVMQNAGKDTAEQSIMLTNLKREHGRWIDALKKEGINVE